MTPITDKLSKSLEDYLKAIFLIAQKETVARSKDIASRLDVKRAAVTGALKRLAEKGLVNYSPYSYITLTSEGETIAKRLAHRHNALRDFFVEVLAINEEKADAEACRMEHGMSKEVVDRLVEFSSFLDVCPRTGKKWIRSHAYHDENSDPTKQECKHCIEKCIQGLREKQSNNKENVGNN